MTGRLGSRWRMLAAAVAVSLAGCATSDRVIRGVGAFGNPYSLTVQRPYVYGGGDFCGSRLTTGDGDIVWYDVFTRASQAECEALGREFVTRSESRDPFPGGAVLNCRMTDPYTCERVLRLQEDLAERFAVSGVDGVGASSDDVENLRLFFTTNGRLITSVMFGFDADQPLNLECACVTRQIDPDGHATVTVIICREAARSWIVDAYLTEE